MAALAGLLGWTLAATEAKSTSPSYPATTSTTEAPVISAARMALAAWGEFAISGNLALLESHFDRTGPQYRQLMRESEELAGAPLGDPPYVFSLDHAVVVGGPGEQVVRGEVTVSRRGESHQSYRWDLVMRRADRGWVLWTVEETK